MSPAELEREALKFLSKHHPSGCIPIPIEEIIEFQLDINIVPAANMMNSIGVDAFTSHDISQINIDREQLEKRPNRAGFTLAHEVGHIVLHKDFIESQRFKTEIDWRKFVLNDLHRDPMEVQANMFAALVLIPSNQLEVEFANEKKKLSVHKLFKSANLPPDLTLAPYLAKSLSQKFEVSEEAMTNRLQNWIQHK